MKDYRYLRSVAGTIAAGVSFDRAFRVEYASPLVAAALQADTRAPVRIWGRWCAWLLDEVAVFAQRPFIAEVITEASALFTAWGAGKDVPAERFDSCWMTAERWHKNQYSPPTGAASFAWKLARDLPGAMTGRYESESGSYGDLVLAHGYAADPESGCMGRRRDAGDRWRRRAAEMFVSFVREEGTRR